MSLIDFNKPQKIRSTFDHNQIYGSDSGVAGTYVPNMSDEDMDKWKGTHIKGEDERIEIRKTIGGVQLLIMVSKSIKFTSYFDNRKEWLKNHKNVRISMNGKMDITFDEYDEFIKVIEEAKNLLK